MVKRRCQFRIGTDSRCNEAALRFAGLCQPCGLPFCASHRLPEHHNCEKLEDCRQQAFEMNKSKLESERTVASKIAAT